MRTHLQRDLDALTKKLILVGGMVEDATGKAIAALTERRLDLAEEVQRGDQKVDEREVEVEEDCLKVLALHAPVAADLRRVVAFLKLNNDLERVGDLAKNIAERAAFLALRDPVAIPPQIPEMCSRVRLMLRECLDAVVRADTGLARKVLEDDDIVDGLHKEVYGSVEGRLRQDPQHAQEILQLLSVSRYLERMADQATNVAEDVVFMVDGQVIRHKGG
jgi:phosphate transport system protein